MAKKLIIKVLLCGMVGPTVYAVNSYVVGEPCGDVLRMFASTVSSAFVALLGFILTAETILIGFWRSSPFAPIRNNPERTEQLWTQFHWTMAALGLSAIVTFVSVLPWPPRCQTVLWIVSLLMLGVSAAMVQECVSVLGAAVRLLSSETSRGKSNHEP